VSQIPSRLCINCSVRTAAMCARLACSVHLAIPLNRSVSMPKHSHSCRCVISPSGKSLISCDAFRASSTSVLRNWCMSLDEYHVVEFSPSLFRKYRSLYSEKVIVRGWSLAAEHLVMTRMVEEWMKEIIKQCRALLVPVRCEMNRWWTLDRQ